MILISQGHFTFELTLAGLLEDVLTRFKDERVLLTLSDPAIGIRGDLFIAESTIFAARVDKPPIEGYAALRNLCQFGGAEYALRKYEPQESDPAARTICIDLAKLIKSVPALPVDPSSLINAEALVPRMQSSAVVGAPVVVAVPPMQLPPLPPPGSDAPDEQTSKTAKKRIDQAFEAALQKRAANKGKDSPVTGQPVPMANESESGLSKLQKAAALLAANPNASSLDASSMPSMSTAPAGAAPDPFAISSKPASAAAFAASPSAPPVNSAPGPAAQQPFIPEAPAPAPFGGASANPVSTPPVTSGESAPQPVVFQGAVGLGTGEIDWHAVRESAKRVEPVSKEPTVSFSLAEQIQQELSASDEEAQVAEPLKRQALKNTFVGPMAALRFFTGNLGRLILPLAILIVLLQCGKLWMESHGGSAALKLPPSLDFLSGKQAKKGPAPAAHHEAAKPVHQTIHHDAPSHPVSTHATAKSAPMHVQASKTAPAAKDASKSSVAKTAASATSSATAKATSPQVDGVVGKGSSKYPNSLIMRDHMKPAEPAPPRRHAYQTAPDAGDESK